MYKIFTRQSGLAYGYIGKILLIMRLTTVILIASLIQVSAATFGQRITLKVQDMPVGQLLKEIRKQSGYDFFYDIPLIKKAKPVTINVKDATIEEVLNKSFQNQRLTYKIDNKLVMVKAMEPSFLDNIISAFDRIDVRGKVVNESGEPMNGATIKVKGTNISLTTSNDGVFFLANIDDQSILTISFIGYKTKEMKVAPELGMIKMEIGSNELEEITVLSTGYQNIPKERVTGSFVQIDNKLLNRQLGTNVIDRIVDVTSGLNFSPNRVDGGNRSNINIRGISTINSSMKPLIVLDNFPYDGDLANINPNDIESITVLRDAAAASIWGVRSGNGVIVVTTKQGQFNQETTIQFNSNVTIGQKPRIFDVPIMSSNEVIGFQKKLFAEGFYDTYDDNSPSVDEFPTLPEVAEILLARRRGTISADEAAAKIEALSKQDVRNDISRYTYQNNINQQHALNFSGGTGKYKYYGSYGFDGNRSSFVGDSYNRSSIRLDNTYMPLKDLEINGFISYVHSKNENNSIGMSAPNGSGQLAPYTRFKDSDGKNMAIPFGIRQAFKDTISNVNLLDWNYRPIDEQDNKDVTSRQFDARMGLGVKYTMIPGLNISVKYQHQTALILGRSFYNMNNYLTRDLFNRFVSGTSKEPVFGVPLGGILDQQKSELTSWNFRSQLNFDKGWGNHEISALAGVEYKETNIDGNVNRTYGYDDQTNQTNKVDYTEFYRYFANPGFQDISIPYNDLFFGNINRYGSYFANAGYTYAGRYSLTGSARVDGSNFYGIKANQREVPLWSMGLGWELSKESYFGLSWLPYAKFRASIGYTGNTNNSAAAYSLISFAQDALTLARTASITRPPNPSLRWEKMKILNFGFDFGSKNNRLRGTIEYYKKDGLDLISNIAVDPTSGVANYVGNNATLKGGGVDLTLNAVNINSSGFTWNTDLLFSYTRDKVTKYNVKANTVNQYFTEGTPVVGRPLFSVYKYNWAGLDPVTGMPRVTLKGDISDYNSAVSTATPEDLAFVGSALPKYFGSFRNSFAFNALSISVNITYKLGYYFKRNSIEYYGLYNNWGGHSDYGLRWNQPGDEKNTDIPAIPSFSEAGNVDFIYKNSMLVDKGDHIRLQDVRLSYDFSKHKIKRLGFANAQVFMYATNLGLLWKASKSDVDPEYPLIRPSRTIALGLSMQF